jgi:hypothetical protein
MGGVIGVNHLLVVSAGFRIISPPKSIFWALGFKQMKIRRKRYPISALQPQVDFVTVPSIIQFN